MTLPYWISKRGPGLQRRRLLHWRSFRAGDQVRRSASSRSRSACSRSWCTFYRIGTDPQGGTRLGVETSFQFTEYNGWAGCGTIDNGNDKAPFEEARLEDLLGATATLGAHA